MKRLRIIVSVSIGIILVISVLILWLLKTNGITEFDEEKNQYQPLVSKEDERTPEFEKGLAIFLNDCAKCHVTKNKLHNYLDGVVKEYGEQFVAMFITKQDSLIENKNDLAIAIKREWGNNGNSHNFNYSDKELSNLIEYLK
ncbi:c-type cytochrome [Flagellimonas onchidii]|uniref:c-type cytochrome n=1 Tax=Flagellimonas onchidii TaxID=2562684 RepID=UPI0010A624B7|nr:c-type cytochrome [Allomuricauda onchidii]